MNLFWSMVVVLGLCLSGVLWMLIRAGNKADELRDAAERDREDDDDDPPIIGRPGLGFTCVAIIASLAVVGCASTTTTQKSTETTTTTITETKVQPPPIREVLPLRLDTSKNFVDDGWFLDSSIYFGTYSAPKKQVLTAKRAKSPGNPGITVYVVQDSSHTRDIVYISIDPDSATMKKTETTKERVIEKESEKKSGVNTVLELLFGPLGIAIAIVGAVAVLVIIFKRR